MFVYRLLLILAAPWFALRLWRGGRGAMEQRLGGSASTARRGAVLWLHAASNGELMAARPLIEALLARDPRLTMVVTCNSDTGRALAEGWALDRVSVRLAPLDYRFAVRRFIGGWQPEALILIENEIWPNRMLAMQSLSRPVIVLSGRMSAKSARIWKKLPGLAQRVMDSVAYLSAQDAASPDRFVALGLPEEHLGPVLNLKTQDAPGGFDAAEKHRMESYFKRDSTVLAASTHAGEEAVILRGFAKALKERPGLRLIIAPRHPHRRGEVAALIEKQGLPHATRSTGGVPHDGTPVFLADTMGEMPLWYELAAITFIGGSLAPRGGHTPFEPAAHRSALLHGPHLENFAEVYAALERAGASFRVESADELGNALLSLDAGTRVRMTDLAAEVVAEMQESAGLNQILDRLADLTGDANLRGR